MRYYDITVGGMHVTSHPNGLTAPPTPGALNVEFDILQGPEHIPGGGAGGTGNSQVRIWGISIQDIAQARSLSNKAISVRAGMGKGLPLANPAQAGLLIKGQVWQAFGNWQGTNMSLDLIVIPGTGTAPPALPGDPLPAKNLTWIWPANTSMSDAIKQALTVAYPNFAVNLNISANLKRPNNEWAIFQNLTQFAEHINATSRDILGKSNSSGQNYPGVSLVLRNDAFYVDDGTGGPTNPKSILFTDLVGQVTWIGLNTIQVAVVMRGDLNVNEYIKLPPGQVAVTAQSYPSVRQGSIFQGSFQIIKIRHVGNFRQPMGQAWMTVIDAITSGQSPGTQGASAAPGATVPSTAGDETTVRPGLGPTTVPDLGGSGSF